MKRLLITLLAASAVAGALPTIAVAHGDDDAGYARDRASDWGGNVGTFAAFDVEYRHIVDGIRHGLSDGSYRRDQANGFYAQMQRIRQRAYTQQVRGEYDPEWTEGALAGLHARMHAAHARGHERIDHYNASRSYYGQRDDRRDYGHRGYDDRGASAYGYRQ